jgi:TfoX/Sxy family transcriptional regulator of competence genes
MAFSEALAERVRKALGRKSGLAEKKMFGGLAFLVQGNMSVGVLGDELAVRVDPAETEPLLKQPGARRFDMTGRPMKGWLVVGSAGTKDDASLAQWVRRGVQYASSLPKKK